MRKPLIAANWKMNKTIAESVDFIQKLKAGIVSAKDRDVVVCAPFTMLKSMADLAKGTDIMTGAENMYWEEKGAFTGEISPLMLVDAGCKYVIIGHSERRQYFGEKDETVNKKMHAAFKHGLIPIVCVGETLQEREKNITFDVISRQIKAGIAGLAGDSAEKLVIAYEPVWAIGTGKTATPEQAQEVHQYIRKLLAEMYGQKAADSIRVLYGGSMKPDNIAGLMKLPDIDGGLVGGAALEAASYLKLVYFDKA